MTTDAPSRMQLRKGELITEIREAVRRFNDDTGCYVSAIDVTNHISTVELPERRRTVKVVDDTHINVKVEVL